MQSDDLPPASESTESEYQGPAGHRRGSIATGRVYSTSMKKCFPKAFAPYTVICVMKDVTYLLQNVSLACQVSLKIFNIQQMYKFGPESKKNARKDDHHDLSF